MTYATLSAADDELHAAVDAAVQDVVAAYGRRHPGFVGGELRLGDDIFSTVSPVDRAVAIGETAVRRGLMSPTPSARRRRPHRRPTGPSVGRPQRSLTCLYTLDADRDFVLDRVPGATAVVVALGAAHGFEFAAWFGRTLAELILDGSAPHDIGPFAFDRPGLACRPDRAAWLV